MKNQYVQNLDVNDAVNELFVVTTVTARTYGGGSMIHLRLADSTGKINGVIWNPPDDAVSAIKPGRPYRIRGTVGRYQGTLQVTVKGYESIPDISGLDPTDFLPSTTLSIPDTLEELREMGRNLVDPFLSALWAAFFQDDQAITRFTRVPGGKMWHHATVGGLLEHTRSVITICDFLAGHYPDLNRDILLTGALFHDLGKVYELSADVAFDYTDAGRLVGHLTLGVIQVKRYIDTIPGFPQPLEQQVLHMILAHHNEEEGSPRKPMLREAVLLHFADNIDAQYNAFTRELGKIEEPEESWTGFVNLIGRYLYRPPQN